MTGGRPAVPDRVTGVVVAGAGPVGLMLACELRRANVPVIVVERLVAPMTESRASQITTLTAEILHERGFSELLSEAAPEPRAHFGGVSFSLTGLDSDYAGNWKVPQYRTERALSLRAERQGATILRGHELAWVEDSADHVLCGVAGPAGESRVRARYLAGCDGAGSSVRELCGFTASRTPATRELLRADVTGLDVRDRRFELLERGFAVASTRDGITRVMVHAFGQATHPRPTAPAFTEVARVWAAVTGEDISGGKAVWVDAFDNSSGLVGCYRRGRVLLAGDAAHWHMPIGGQAMNVGLQDAVNLGWKLAGAVHGWAPPHLLDTYDTERRPVAAKVLSQVTAQEMVLLGGREAGSLRAMIAELVALAPVRDHLARAVSGLGDRYQLTGCPPGDQLTGQRLPNVKFRAGSGLVKAADLLAGDEAAVILRIAPPGQADADPPETTVRLPGECVIRTLRVSPEPADAFDGITAVLLRPDGYVASAGEDEGGLKAAVDYWFGAPSSAV